MAEEQHELQLMDDDWITQIYDSSSAMLEQFQAKIDSGKPLNVGEEGIYNMCHAIIHMYDELYEAPVYLETEQVEARKRRHFH